MEQPFSSNKTPFRPSDGIVESSSARLRTALAFLPYAQVRTWHAVFILLFIAGIAAALIITVTTDTQTNTRAASSASACRDLNQDGVTDVTDLGALLSNWGKTDKPPADCDQNGSVDVTDLGVLLSNWGKSNPPSGSGVGIWISPQEIAALPMSGAAWDALRAAAEGNWGTANLADNNSTHDTSTLAGALVAARTGDAVMREKTVQGLQSAMQSGLSRALELSRGLQTYIIAADIIGYRTSEFEAWVRDMVEKNVSGHSGGSGVQGTAKMSATNWGGHARASLAAAALYLNDQAYLDAAVRAHQAFIGLDVPNEMTYTGTNWHPDPNHKAGVNRKGTAINGMNVSGVLPEDWRRAAEFQWPPSASGYMWEGMQGFVVTAVVLHRAGLVPFSAGDNAVRRAVDMLYGRGEAEGNIPVYHNHASSDDTWIPWDLITTPEQIIRQKKPAPVKIWAGRTGRTCRAKQAG